MKKLIIIMFMLTFILLVCATGQERFESDIIKTSVGDLKLTFIAHGTLMFTFNDKVIHIDPVGRYTDYENMPDADLILVTHEHGDQPAKVRLITVSS